MFETEQQAMKMLPVGGLFKGSTWAAASFIGGVADQVN